MKIFCVGRNYVAHAKELGNEVPDEPVIFMKPESALLPFGTKFKYPDFTKDLHYEAELVFQICKEGKNISVKNATSYYDKITVGIDFTARDIQSKLKTKGLPWEKAKAFDHSAVIGNWVDLKPETNPKDIHFTFEKNGEVVQAGHTHLMLFSIDQVIANISIYFSLNVGDLIFTGTPQGVGECVAGDNLVGILEGEQVFSLDVIS
jgi:2-keto-4-pentenoate hydratase/2-oxohepta-3-ene-1,7-dioic acid hydratase in catechol pathway